MPPTQALQVDAVEATAEGADLRGLRFHGIELVRRLYAAVRDPDWGTLSPGSLEVAASASEGAQLGWHASFDTAGIELDARGESELAADGVLVASFCGVARSSFRYNRIGLCLLLPPEEFAGTPFVAHGPDGVTNGTLPMRIGPQQIVDGLPAPLFPAFSRLELHGRSGALVDLNFEGDLFEVEDQRNWTDNSFKIYSTPLALGFPHRASEGQRFEQRVTLRTEAPARPRIGRPETVSLRLGATLGRGMPPLGLGAPSHHEPLAARAAELLRVARPSHIRMSLPAGASAAEAAIETTAGLASTLRTRIQVALTLGSDPHAQLEELRSRLEWPDSVSDVIVLAADGEATTGLEVRVVRESLAPTLRGARFHAGTEASFCQLNRAALDLDGVDGVSYAIQPQVHAFDDSSLFETLVVQGETVDTARDRFGSLPILVGPITLRPPFDPAAGESALDMPAELPADPRQLSLLGAAWTVGSVKYLSAAGADAVTYYETTGWRGLVETDAGSPEPDLFCSRPGETFPLYHVFADAVELRGALTDVESSEPLAAVAIASEAHGVIRALVANLRPQPTEVELSPLPTGSRRIRRLNEESAALAAAHPSHFRTQWTEISADDSRLRLRLEPYEVLRLEAA